MHPSPFRFVDTEAVKNAQEQTRQVLERVRHGVREADFSTLCMWVRELRTAARLGDWPRALLFAEECPVVAERLRNATGLEDSERQGLREGADNLRLVQTHIRTTRLNTQTLGLAANHAMIWLVRHGESEGNAGAATSDYAAIPLTERGYIQARQVAGACPEPPQRVVFSPYRRARQTALPLLDRFPAVPVEELAVQEFTYLAKDRCRGLDNVARQPLVDAYWNRMEPSCIVMAKGRSRSAFFRVE